VDDLLAAIADHLRHHNVRLRPGRAERVWSRALWDYGRPQVRCRSCGGPILADGDVKALGPLLAAGLCLGCYLREAA
jgi:hypothetical protein